LKSPRSSYRRYSLILIMVLLCLPALFFSGCKGGGSTAASSSTTAVSADINAGNIMERVVAAQQNIKTYEFSMESTIQLKGNIEGEKGDMKMSFSGSGAMDVANNKTRVETTTTVAGTASGKSLNESTRTSTYIIDNVAYVGQSDKTGKLVWRRQPVPNLTNEQNQVEKQMKIFKNSVIKTVGTDNVQGVPCYVVEIDPEMPALWDDVVKQAASMGISLDVFELKDSLKSVSVKYWFSQDTLFLKQDQVDMVLEFTPKAGQTGSGQVNMNSGMTVEIKKYNQAVLIQVPAEAKAKVQD
jgi:hypothetical protein